MNTCVQKVTEMRLSENEVAIIWLGQAGYLIKAYPDIYLAIDPYLSNACESSLGPGFKRLMPNVIAIDEVDELPLSAYLITHEHEDHLDPVTIRSLQRTDYSFYAPPTSLEILGQLGKEEQRLMPLTEGAVYCIGNAKVTAVFADHGELSPDATGLMIEVNDQVIYHMGDTCFNEDELVSIRNRFNQIDVLIAPINGKYGNMDESDAVKAAQILKPRFTTPCHFWMLPGNSGGDPLRFLNMMKEICPGTQARLLRQGEIWLLDKGEADEG